MPTIEMRVRLVEVGSSDRAQDVVRRAVRVVGRSLLLDSGYVEVDNNFIGWDDRVARDDILKLEIHEAVVLSGEFNRSLNCKRKREDNGK